MIWEAGSPPPNSKNQGVGEAGAAGSDLGKLVTILLCANCRTPAPVSLISELSASAGTPGWSAERRFCMGRNVHVVPQGDRWVVREEGREAPLSMHRTQRDAVGAAEPIARWNRSDVVIHRPDGTIRDRDSYGSDPIPPRDKKH